MRLAACCLLVVFLFFDANSAEAQSKKSKVDKSERLKQLDKNNDGKLSRDEMSDALWKRLAPYDVNGDGALSSEELAGTKVGEGERRPGGATAAFTVCEFRGTNGQTLPYSLFQPKETKPGEKLPLVLCLHGAGGNTQAAKVLAATEQQAKHPCFVLAPACEGKATRWVKSTFRAAKEQRAVEPELIELLDALAKELPIDMDRVYVTGQSMGGLGTWGLIAAHPARFAAAVPVCGLWEAADGAKIARVPLWAFHGAKDPTVPVDGTRRMIEAMKAAGGAPRYTEYADVGHGSWDAAYATAEMWDWMFEQRRTGAAAAP